MARPIYEKSSDRSAEEIAIKKFINSFDPEVEFFKLPIQYKMDFALVRNGQITALVEVKSRKNKKNAYPTYMISMSKLTSAASYKAIGINCILLIQWSDQIGWIQMNHKEWTFKVGGRKDRNDWQDIEPVGHISVKNFKEI